MNKTICKVKNCNNTFWAKGLCHKCYSKQWRANHYKYSLEYAKQHYQDNKKKILASKKQYRIDNKERKDAYDKQWRVENKERSHKSNKQWRQTLKGKAITKKHRHNRRMLDKGLTLAIVQRVYETNIAKYGRLTCVLCFKPIKFGDDSLEHLTPISRGGKNEFKNLAVAHQKCNNQKYTMTLKEWEKKHIINQTEEN